MSAPPGFGKTVLLADATAGDAVAWVSLDRYDANVGRFWRHVLAALEPWRTGLPAWPVTATDAARSRFFDAFLGVLTDGEPLWLVLDGVAPGLPRGVAAQVKRNVLGWLPQLRLAITTRGSLDEIVLTSRLRGLLATLDERDLAYTRAELDQVVAGTLPAGGVAAIHELTAGWPGAVAALLHAAGRDDGDALLDRARTEAPELILGPWFDGLGLRRPVVPPLRRPTSMCFGPASATPSGSATTAPALPSGSPWRLGSAHGRPKASGTSAIRCSPSSCAAGPQACRTTPYGTGARRPGSPSTASRSRSCITSSRRVTRTPPPGCSRPTSTRSSRAPVPRRRSSGTCGSPGGARGPGGGSAATGLERRAHR